jgi:hypothetical protein
MFSCQKITELLSRSLDEPLSFTESVRVAIHALLCPSCAFFAKQLDLLHKLVQVGAEAVLNDAQDCAWAELSPEARERIQQAVEQNLT